VSVTLKLSGLTKSKVMIGIQCEKALFLTVNQSDLAGPIDATQQALFDQGHNVGVEAQKRFPGGVLIDVPRREMGKAIKLTKEAIENGSNTIYEGTFEYCGVLTRVDILHRKSAKKSWQIIEVKSSTSVKDEHLTDLAIQSWVLAGAGVEHDKAMLMHINNQCVFPDLSKLFTISDCTKDIAPLLKEIPNRVKVFQKMLASSLAPDREIGPHCSTPYDCGFQDYCWNAKKIPKVSVLDLPGASAAKWALYEDGIRKLDDPRIEIDD
jgi:CRISPR/Cas system-associated exonuclease Cas4 (RecB family)